MVLTKLMKMTMSLDNVFVQLDNVDWSFFSRLRSILYSCLVVHHRIFEIYIDEDNELLRLSQLLCTSFIQKVHYLIVFNLSCITSGIV